MAVERFLCASGMAFLLLAGGHARAHDCGKSPLTMQVGDFFPFVISADVLESEPSEYELATSGDPNIAELVTTPDFSSLGWGSWGFVATGLGTTEYQFDWEYAPNNAGARCTVSITVEAGGEQVASFANYFLAQALFDPINSATGEFYFTEDVRLQTSGPLPLSFEMTYASNVLNKRVLDSRLGNNWLHSYDMGLVHDEAGDRVFVQLRQGRLATFTANGPDWDLASPVDIPYQLIETVDGFVLGDPFEHLIYSYDSQGRLVTISDGKGNTHTLSYAGPAVTAVSDGLGRSITFGYNSINLLKTVSDGTRTLNFAHTFTAGFPNLASVNDKAGNVYGYQYATSDTSSGLLTARTLPEGNVHTTQVYGADGRVTSQTDGLGNVSTVAYPGADSVATNPDAQTQTHTYDANGAATGIIDAAGNSITVSNSAESRRTGFTDRTGAVTGYSYHGPSGKVASHTREDGSTATFSYTQRTLANGLRFYDLTGITHYDGTTESFAYDAAGNLLSATDPSGATWSFTYNNRGQVLTETNPLGGVTTRTYNSEGLLASVTEPTGEVRSHTYDGFDRVTTTTYPGGVTETWSYDANNNVTSYTDEAGRTTTLSYDGNGNVVSATDANGKVLSFAYDAMDRLIAITDREGNSLARSFDAVGRIATLTDGDGDVVSFAYDALDRVVSATADAITVVRSYDPEGVTVGLTDGADETQTFTTDAVGRYTDVNTPLGHATSVAYDSMGRVVSTTDASGASTTYTYDARGLLEGIDLPEGISASYVRNAVGQVTEVTGPRGFERSFTYDTAGRRTSHTDELGNTTQYLYDSSGRLSQLTLPEGSMTLAYDAATYVTSRSFSDGTTISYGYDTVGRLDSGTGLTRTYDGNGAIVESNGLNLTRTPGQQIATLQFAPGKTVTYGYDGNGRVTAITDWVGGTTTLTYDDAGQTTAIERPNGVTTTYAYDADGNLVSQADGGFVTLDLTYDARGKLVEALRDVPLEPPALAPGQRSATFDAASQTSAFTYDSLGRVTSDDRRAYTWNLADELLQTAEGGTVTEYTYDALGNRLSRSRDGDVREYVWNYALTNPSPSVLRDDSQDLSYFVHTPGGMLLYAVDASDNRLFYHFDESGNAVALSDDAGEVAAAYTYSPSGELRASTGEVENPFTWQGELSVLDDGNGLYAMRARLYDAQTGRFLSRDPAERIGPRNLNYYQYALNDPYGYADPTGARSAKRKATKKKAKKRVAKRKASKRKATRKKKAAKKKRPAKRKGGHKRGAPIRDPEKGAGKKVAITTPVLVGGSFSWVDLAVAGAKSAAATSNTDGHKFDSETQQPTTPIADADTRVTADSGMTRPTVTPEDTQSGANQPGTPTTQPTTTTSVQEVVQNRAELIKRLANPGVSGQPPPQKQFAAPAPQADRVTQVLQVVDAINPAAWVRFAGGGESPGLGLLGF